MHLFSDYLQPLTVWIYANPHWALLFTFLISFTESLAIIGSIIPGSVTMTAIGILAGSGVMRIDLTLITAALGAIAGDGVSYALGYRFRNQITNLWPFSRYPHWLTYGKEYFAKHGGKSVLIGRFIGPLRSVIPVIAGMMHMNHWHFLLANVISAIGWSIVYVVPGILIGAASSELSAESASRLFLIILLVLVLVWLLSITIKWLISRISIILQVHLHQFWRWSKNHPQLSYYIDRLTPEYEKDHYHTAQLMLLWLFCIFFLLIMIALSAHTPLIQSINQPTYLFLQSLRTPSFDAFFIMIDVLFHPVPLIGLWLSAMIIALTKSDLRTVGYWACLALASIALFVAFKLTVLPPSPKPYIEPSSIALNQPTMRLIYATALLNFLMFYLNACNRGVFVLLLRLLFWTVFFLEGIGVIYLGINWISNVLIAYSLGFSIGIAHWIAYRRKLPLPEQSYASIIMLLIYCIAVAICNWFYFKTIERAYRPYIRQYVLTDAYWWQQKQPLLPIYTTNRIGRRTGLFNIQYVGDIESFEQALTAYGWRRKPESFFYSLLIRASGKESEDELPLMAQLYKNRKPALVMTYESQKDKSFWVIRLWRSNYHIQTYKQPIWLGSVHPQKSNNKRKEDSSTLLTKNQKKPFQHLFPALNNFHINRLKIKHLDTKALPFAVAPEFLLIKECQPHKSHHIRSESDLSHVK